MRLDIVFLSLSELDIFMKLGIMEVIFLKKQARFILNTPFGQNYKITERNTSPQH
jgi:hypothetical protein